MSYVAITVGLIGVICILLIIADRIEFYYYTDRHGNEIPIMKYLIWFVCSFLSLAVINVSILVNELESYGMTNTLAVFYKAVLFSVIFIFTIWIFGFAYDILLKLWEDSYGKN